MQHVQAAAGPIFLGVGIVLGQAAQTLGAVSVAWRPLVVAVIVGAVAYLVAAALLRNRTRATVASTIFIALLGGLALIVVVGALILLVVAFGRRIRGYEGRLVTEDRIARVIPRLTGIFALVGLVGLVAFGPVMWYRGSTTIATTNSSQPPIYVLLLDGYPRQDMLQQYFDIDNEPFLSELDARGFDVYRDATSNHTLTALTLATMFNATPADALPVEGETHAQQYRSLHRLMNDGSVWDALHARGYRIVTIPPTPDNPKLMTADVYMDGGQLLGFEVHMIQTTAIGWLLELVEIDWIYDEHRSRLDAAFEALPQIEGAGSFVFAHFFLPHRPVVYRADGSPRPPGACQDDCNDAEFYPAYAEQLAYTNARILAAIDELPPNAVIVLFSDHGSREPADPREWLRTLLVARTPGHYHLFGDDPTPTSWFPRLLNTYAGTELPESDGGHWRSHRLPMDVDPVDP